MCVFFALKERDLVASLQPPAKYKKAAYFVKLARGAVSTQTMDTAVVPSELTPDMLGQMYKLCQEVYLPIMSNPENQHRSWWRGPPARAEDCAARARLAPPRAEAAPTGARAPPQPVLEACRGLRSSA